MTAPKPEPAASRHREPLRVTLLRTGTIAAAVGAVVAWRWGQPSVWPAAMLLALWPAFGGHWVEVGFLNGIRPRLPGSRVAQVLARLGVWFVGGAALTLGMVATAMALAPAMPQPLAWAYPSWQFVLIGALGFVAIELAVHLILQLTGRPSFYNGRG